jgi:hypothetical protein
LPSTSNTVRQLATSKTGDTLSHQVGMAILILQAGGNRYSSREVNARCDVRHATQTTCESSAAAPALVRACRKQRHPASEAGRLQCCDRPRPLRSVSSGDCSSRRRQRA